MKKTLLPALSLLIAFAPLANAENFSLTSYYPAPTANYTQIYLVPRGALPTNNCQLGTLYSNSNDHSVVYYCTPNAPLPQFQQLPGIWALNVNSLCLYPADTPSRTVPQLENEKVGIGTTTPMFKLTLDNDGGILAEGDVSTSSALVTSGEGTRLMWYPQKAAFRAGTVNGTQWDDANTGNYTLALGYNSIAQYDGNTVLGGNSNSSTGYGSATIVGGKNNLNEYGGLFSTMVGGENNLMRGYWASSITGGYGNTTAGGHYNAIGGGKNNLVGDTEAMIIGGYNNNASRYNSSILGGANNQVLTHGGSVLGGQNNIVGNSAPTCCYPTVSGGKNNVANNGQSVISGGAQNSTHNLANTISGGFNNQTWGAYSTISGGSNNSTSDSYASIAGGANNTAGYAAMVIGGQSNTASGSDSVIIGGANNTAAGNFSFSAGKYMNLSSSASNTFLWGYSDFSISPINTANAFIIYSGRVGIRDTNPAALLEINANASANDDYLDLTSTAAATPGNVLIVKNTGANTANIGVGVANPVYPLQFGNGAYVDTNGNFVGVSSRKYKENITDLDLTKAYSAFQGLTPVRYYYKNEKDQEYVGFIAEDVPALVADKARQGVSPLDIAAVLTKVISRQQDVIDQQKEIRRSLLKEVHELKKQGNPLSR